jgi:N utilization substance protein A
MVVRLSDEARRYIAAFEDATDVPARDCVLEKREPRSGADGSSGGGPRDERAVFVLPPGTMADAIGPDGRTVAAAEERLGRRVELVADAEEPGDFVANALRPAAVYGVTVAERERDGEPERVAYAEVDAADFGAAIGSGGRNVEMATRLAGRHHGVDAIELVPDPDSVIDAVEAEAGVEPVDALFDPAEERLLVVVPAGRRTAAVGEDGTAPEALRADLGWPVEVVAYASDAAGLVANALAPADVRHVTVSEAGVAYAEVPDDERGLAIGRDGRRIRRARLLARRYHDLDDVELA